MFGVEAIVGYGVIVLEVEVEVASGSEIEAEWGKMM